MWGPTVKRPRTAQTFLTTYKHQQRRRLFEFDMWKKDQTLSVGQLATRKWIVLPVLSTMRDWTTCCCSACSFHTTWASNFYRLVVKPVYIHNLQMNPATDETQPWVRVPLIRLLLTHPRRPKENYSPFCILLCHRYWNKVT